MIYIYSASPLINRKLLAYSRLYFLFEEAWFHTNFSITAPDFLVSPGIFGEVSCAALSYAGADAVDNASLPPSISSVVSRAGRRSPCIAACVQPVRTGWYKAFRSAGGFRRPLRSLTRKKLQQNAGEADREVHDFRRKLATAESSHAAGEQPGRRMHLYTEYRKGSRERAVSYLVDIRIKTNPSRIAPVTLLL